MAEKDIAGVAYALHDELKPGDHVRVDGGFTCLPEGARRRVHVERDGSLYIRCGGSQRRQDEGDEPRTRPQKHVHLLDGQKDGEGYLVGVYRT